MPSHPRAQRVKGGGPGFILFENSRPQKGNRAVRRNRRADSPCRKCANHTEKEFRTGHVAKINKRVYHTKTGIWAPFGMAVCDIIQPSLNQSVFDPEIFLLISPTCVPQWVLVPWDMGSMSRICNAFATSDIFILLVVKISPILNMTNRAISTSHHTTIRPKAQRLCISIIDLMSSAIKGNFRDMGPFSIRIPFNISCARDIIDMGLIPGFILWRQPLPLRGFITADGSIFKGHMKDPVNLSIFPRPSRDLLHYPRDRGRDHIPPVAFQFFEFPFVISTSGARHGTSDQTSNRVLLRSRSQLRPLPPRNGRHVPKIPP